ncbi:MAG: metalloregulator ArsR/SmtB family transcription factor [Sandaracinaceae bacterium]
MTLVTIAAVLQALADETRLRLLHVLWRGQDRRFRVGELVEVLDLPQPTVSRHLAVLRSHGLVECERQATYRRYTLAATQPRLHAAVLGALEGFVPSTPRAREDAARLTAIERDTSGLTRPALRGTNRFPYEDAAMDHVFRALAHPTRRRLLDIVGRRPGATLGEAAAPFDESRVAIAKHVATLEKAGLMHSRRSGRERRLYADPMPVQLAYDRWTDRFSAAMAERMADVKYAAEGREP